MQKNEFITRFVKYTKMHTTSDPLSSTYPSTKRQFDLLNLLDEELKSMNIESEVSEFGVLYAKIPANIDYQVDAVGFVAHVDTAPDFNGKNVNPQIIEKYDGQDIILNEEYTLSPNDFASLKDYVGKTIIHTDGTSLLGADDKSGVTIIMQMAKYYAENPQIEHGDICIAFTCDEEIGKGTVNFDVQKFGADFAYTIDGGLEGEFSYENFNAYDLNVEIKGRNVHPGTAKNQMVNAAAVAIKFDNLLDPKARPQYTEGYEGFMHLIDLTANVENANLAYIIRDHDANKIDDYFTLIEKNVVLLQQEFPNASIEYNIEKRYLNMAEVVLQSPKIIEYVKTAMKNTKVTPIIEPIRGGTDGSNLSFMNLPCPNIFTGGHNFHGRFEYVCVDSMLKAYEVVIEIIKEVKNNKVS